MDQENDVEEVKKSLFGLLGEMIDMLNANTRLKNPADSLDPKALRSFIVTTDELRDSRGEIIQGY